jgi:hypothetical protein
MLSWELLYEQSFCSNEHTRSCRSCHF